MESPSSNMHIVARICLERSTSCFINDFQKQPTRGILKKRCSENMQQIYRRTPMPKCNFNKVALLCNFIEITLRHGCYPVNLLHIFRTPFPRNISGWLILDFVFQVISEKTLCSNDFTKNLKEIFICQ